MEIVPASPFLTTSPRAGSLLPPLRGARLWAGCTGEAGGEKECSCILRWNLSLLLGLTHFPRPLGKWVTHHRLQMDPLLEKASSFGKERQTPQPAWGWQKASWKSCAGSGEMNGPKDWEINPLASQVHSSHFSLATQLQEGLIFLSTNRD